MIDFDKLIYSAFSGDDIVEYTEDIASKVPEEFRANVDEQLVVTTGADSCILWKMRAKIFIKAVPLSDGEIEYRMAGAAIPPGYSEEAHMYSIHSRVYVEDDYAWTPLPPFCGREICTETVYTDSDMEDGFDDDIDCESDDVMPKIAKETDGKVKDDFFMLNFQESDWDLGNTIKLEPLIVESFDLDNPVLKLEIAYRNAICEIESYPTCGWIVLMHGGHFYVPVEVIDDPVNHEKYYYYKIFNSYPTGITSARIQSIATLELFGASYEVALRYRPGYSINWRRYFLDQLLPDDYESQIPDLYSLSDKPYGETTGKKMGYDGIECEYYEDDDSDENNQDDI